MTIMELKHQLDLLLAEAGADVEVLLPGGEPYDQLVLLRHEGDDRAVVQIRGATPECFYCGRLLPEEQGDFVIPARVCDKCYSKFTEEEI